jgi:outer membrane immunogenic protein
MKRYLVSVAAIFLGIGTAQAADPVDPGYDWTGFYVGLHGGYAFGGQDEVGLTVSNGNFFNIGDLELEGFFGGGQAGYNFQNGGFVFGVEADVSVGDVDDSLAFAIPALAATARSDVDFFGTFRGRAGFAIDRVLFYGTGGLAWGDVDYRVFAVDAGANTVLITDNDFEFGFAVGGGAEFAVTDNVRLGLQYLYYNLGGDRLRGAVLDAGGVPNGVTVDTIRTTDFHSVRLNLDWNF